MKLSISKLCLSATLGILLIMNTNTLLAASINWQSYSNSAFTSAKEQDKLVLVYVKSDTCHWCTRMNTETLNKSAIANLISKKFIPVIVDRDTDASIADKFNVNGTPTIIILNSEQHEISRSEGFTTASEFKSYLQGIK